MKKISIDPISFVIWMWLLIMQGFLCAINCVFAIIFHEMGHFFVAKKCGYKLTKFSISPYGVELGYFDQVLDFKDELKIALAGPLANLFSCFLICGLWWIFPSSYFFTQSFVLISLVLAFSNLLPAYPLDGGRVFVCFFSHFTTTKRAQKLTMIFNVAISAIFFVLFFVCLFVNFNPSLLLFAVFLFAGMLDLSEKTKFEKINIFSKNVKNFSKPIFFYVKKETKICELLKVMQTSKTTIFCVDFGNGRVVNISEKMVINLSIIYGINFSLEEILKK